jgi:hypothetical protein
MDALLGIVLASFILIACLALLSSALDAKSAAVLPPLPSFQALVPVVLGYGSLMLSVLRALALTQSARGRDWMAVSLLVPAGAYLWIAEASSHSVETLATEFMVFASLLLLYFGSISLLLDWRRSIGMRKARL